jgi:hypothetical protein
MLQVYHQRMHPYFHSCSHNLSGAGYNSATQSMWNRCLTLIREFDKLSHHSYKEVILFGICGCGRKRITRKRTQKIQEKSPARSYHQGDQETFCVL